MSFSPPVMSQVVTPVAPARGSLLNAWFSLAVIPSRRNFAAWAMAIRQGWVTSSVAVAVVIPLLFNILGIVSTDLQYRPTPSSYFRFVIGIQIANAGIALVSSLIIIFGTPLIIAWITPVSFGPLGVRYSRALRPWALAQVGISLFSVATSLLAIPLRVGFIQGVRTPSAVFVIEIVSIAWALPALIYTLVMAMQAGSLASYAPRWLIGLLSFIFRLVLGIVTIVLSDVFAFVFTRVT